MAAETKNIRRLNFREHALLRPDYIIGDCSPSPAKTWLYNPTTRKFEWTETSVPKGLHVIIDEIISNATDRKNYGLSQIRIAFDPEFGDITVRDDGGGMKVVKFAGTDEYEPTVAFSQDRSSSNFDDTEARYGVGRNGYGAKATNVFSKKFQVETYDPNQKLLFRQMFENNLETIRAAQVSKLSRKRGYMEIRFVPDYERFQMSQSLPDVEKLILTRATDIVACTDKSIGVFWNDDKLPAKTFKEFIKKFFCPDDAAGPVALDSVTLPQGNCEIALVKNDDSSATTKPLVFVNALRCCEGKHIDWIYRQLRTAYTNSMSKKDQDLIKLDTTDLKQHFVLVASLWIPNPEYTTATKEKLRNPPSSFGFTWEPTKAFINSLNAMGLKDILASKRDIKNSQLLSKALNTTQRKGRMPHVDKHDPALMAGQPGHTNTLILTEGDSAKSLAIAGVAVVGRQNYGVFPLRGKFLNVRSAPEKKIAENTEVSNLMKIIGLRIGDKTQKIKDLFYQRILLFTDSDHDGAHICGLVYNFFHYFFRHLLEEKEDFLVRFATPVVKMFPKGRQGGELAFFSVQDMQRYLQENEIDESKFRVRFYKGLGTSSNKEAKHYFAHLDKHLMVLRYTQPETDEILDDLFSKQKADERKRLLKDVYDPNATVDYNESSIKFEDYAKKEVLHFSQADNVRSIPSAIDGLKPCQRKILWTFLHRKIYTDKKVPEAAGDVSGETAYHHGETSLHSAIIGMAQNHIGTNNINLLVPQGQHGSRINDPSVHSASRYLFTWTSSVASYLFPPSDFPVLEYNFDDGKRIEPTFFVPIIPYVLVNGCTGIGTGYSTDIPSYNPFDLIGITRAMIQNSEIEFDQLTPWVEGFKGKIIKDGEKFTAIGCWTTDPATRTIHVTELPPKTWTDPYLAKIGSLMSCSNPAQTPLVEDFVSNSNENDIDIAITCNAEPFSHLQNIAKQFHLSDTIRTTNMHAFSKTQKLKHYTCIRDFFEEYFPIRLKLYEKRKQHALQKLQDDMKILQNKVRFILAIVQERLKIRNYSKSELIEYLRGEHYDHHPTQEEHFHYLYSMQLLTCTTDHAEKLKQSYEQLQQEYDNLQNTGVRDMWLAELDALEKHLREFYEIRVNDRLSDGTQDNSVNMIKRRKSKKRKRPAKKSQ